MSASYLHADSTRPILLATLGGAIVSIAVCAGAFQRLGAAPIAAPSPIDGAAVATDALAPQEIEVARSECDLSPSAAALDAESTLPPSAAVVPITRAKERDLRSAFVALEHAEPGSLDARAGGILSGNGPSAEKIALLRALRDTQSPSTAPWLERVVRDASAEPSVHSGSLPAFALEQLTELAAGDAGARAKLGRVAFDAADVALDLRRRASAAFALVCSGDDLPELNERLWREQDELVIAGALAALASRTSDLRVERVLASHARKGCETHIDEAESSN